MTQEQKDILERAFEDLEWIHKALQMKRYDVLGSLGNSFLAARRLGSPDREDNLLFANAFVYDLAVILKSCLLYKVPDDKWTALIDLITNALKLVRDGLIENDRNMIFEALLNCISSADSLHNELALKSEKVETEPKG